MPTEDANFARVMRALLSVGDVTLEDVETSYRGENRQHAHRLTVVLDSQHAKDVSKFLYPDLAEIRMRLSGWHFSQEGLTSRERDILSLGEQLLTLIDREGIAQ